MKIRSIGSNKTEVELKDLLILVSYQTPVAAIRLTGEKPGAIKTNQFWSVTTLKHIITWLNERGYNPELVPTMDQSYFDQLLE